MDRERPGPAGPRRFGERRVSLDQTSAIAMLYRRIGFGATEQELSSAVTAGYSATVNSLLGGLGQPDSGGDSVAPPSFEPVGQLRTDTAARQAYIEALRTNSRELIVWWVTRMIATTNPAQEKLTLLLHGHFPTAISKVHFAQFMYRQNQLFRTQGSGRLHPADPGGRRGPGHAHLARRVLRQGTGPQRELRP